MSRWFIGIGSLVLASCLSYSIRQVLAHRRLLLFKKHQDEKLDEALRESFPASDPR
jgi:hypothetical protein